MRTALIGAMVVAALSGVAAGQFVELADDGASDLRKQEWSAARSAGSVADVLGGRAGALAPEDATCLELVDLNGPLDGDFPREVVFLPDGSTAAVCHRDSNNVTFVDIATRTVTGGVDVGEGPVSIDATPDGQYLVTADLFGNSVSVVDVASRTVAATIATPSEPYRVEVTADGAYAVVGCTPADGSSSFTVIDLGTLSAVRTFATGGQGVYGGFGNSTYPISGFIFGSWGIAPDNATIVLPVSGTPSGTVEFYDLTTGGFLGDVTVPSGGRSVDIAQDGSIAVVPCTGNSQTLVVLDVPGRSISSTIPTATNLDDNVQLSADNTKAVCGYLNDTFFIDLATGSELSRTVTGSIGDYELTFDDQYLLVSNFNTRVFSMATNSVVDTMSYAATQEMATSPVSHFAAGLNNRFGEQIHLYSTNGSSSNFLAALDGGTSPEGDAPFIVDVSDDGSTAVVGMTLSANVAIVDLTQNPPVLRSLVSTGTRVVGVAISPDGSTAVACNDDSDTVSIIDLATDTVVKTLVVPSAPSQVLISPDSTMAYVLSIAGTDQLHFIQLNGAASARVGSVLAGQAGGWFGPAFSEESGIALSPDGSIVAVCDSFNDALRLMDTASRSLIAVVPVGDYPVRAAFLPDGSKVYVTNAFSDNVSVVEVNGAASTTVATISAGDSTLAVAPDPTGSYVYVTDHAFSGGSQLFVIDTATDTLATSFSLGGGYARDSHMSPDGTLHVLMNINTQLGTVAEVRRYAAAGAGTSLLDTTPLSNSNSRDFAVSDATGQVVISKPFLDAAEVVCFGAACPADLSPAPNGDGTVNTNDFFQFLTYYQAMDARADFSPGGGINTNDFFAFLAAYQQGC